MSLLGSAGYPLQRAVGLPRRVANRCAGPACPVLLAGLVLAVAAARARRGSQSPADRPPAGHRRVYGLLAGARPGPGRPERRARAGHPGAVRAGGQHPVADQRPRGRLGARRDPVRRRRAAHPERADRWRPRGRARLRRLQQRWRPGRQDRPGRWQPRQSPRQPDQHAGVPAREVAGQQPGSGGVVMRALSSAIRSSAIPAAKLLRLPVMAAVLLAAALVPAPLFPAAASTAAPAAPQNPAGGCFYRPVPGGYELVCTNNGGTPGAPGSGGSGGGSAKSACTLTPLSEQQVRFLGLPWPAPKGHTWEAITCPGTQPFVGVTLVNNANGAPAVTPQQLAQIAIGETLIPGLQPPTRPPRGRDGLVGLPEWFWIPRPEWGPISRTVTAGPVWARATAVPVRIVFVPGGGQTGISCRGPGTPYQPSLPLSAQRTDC